MPLSDANREDVADIRLALWSLLAELREGEVDAEAGETMISAIDSLIDLTRLEGELLRQQRGAEDASGKKDAERTA